MVCVWFELCLLCFCFLGWFGNLVLINLDTAQISLGQISSQIDLTQPFILEYERDNTILNFKFILSLYCNKCLELVTHLEYHFIWNLNIGGIWQDI